MAGHWQPGLALGTGKALGLARRYWLYRPPAQGASARNAPMPMLVMLHGCGQDAQGFAASTRMNALARRHGFMVLYPEQDRLANTQGCWNWFDSRHGRAAREAASIVSTIDHVAALYRGDARRVAVAGMSAGASMAALLGSGYPQRFRAVVMHSGVAPWAADSALGALRAMRGRGKAFAATPGASALPPLLVIHGHADAVVAPANGQASAQQWAAAAGASTGAGERRFAQRGQRYPTATTEFSTADGVQATLVEVAGLGHAWSGGAASQDFSDANGPDASRRIWAFVRENGLG